MLFSGLGSIHEVPWAQGIIHQIVVALIWKVCYCIVVNKTEVTDWIRGEHQGRKPLNLSAVKRRRPDLIEFVYSQDTFWGWKNALREAGIEYSSINVELEETITCEICGEQMKGIGFHVQSKHEIPLSEYILEFPDAPRRSEAMNQYKPGQKTIIAHWERAPSPEYILDRVCELASQGYPLNQRSVLLAEPNLIRKAMMYFGSWDTALEMVGLEPGNIRRHRPNGTYTPEYIIEAIQALANEGSNLRFDSLIKTHSTLYARAIKTFGSYAKALEAAGLGSTHYCEYAVTESRYLEFCMKVEGVRSLRGRRRQTAVISLKRDYKDIQYARFAGSWKRVSEELSIDYHKLDRARYPTKEDAEDELSRLRKAGSPIKRAHLLKTDVPLHTAIEKFWGGYRNLRKTLESPVKS